MPNTINIPSVNPIDFRILAVSSLHITCPISEIEFLEHENKRFEIEKENGLSVYWKWEFGEAFPYAMVKLSAAKITPATLKDYGIKKIYFFLVKEV